MAHVGEPVAVYWLDNSLYLNLTNRCSNQCWFCIRNYKQGVGGFNLKHQAEPTSEAVFSELRSALAGKRWSEVVFCGFCEPTARLDLLLEVSRWLKANYPSLPVRLDTNGHGYVLNEGRNVAAELKEAGVKSVSVSLNGYDEETYQENCRPNFKGAFQAVLGFIRKAEAAGLEVEASALRMPENDISKIRAVAEALGVSFRVRDYIPCFW